MNDEFILGLGAHDSPTDERDWTLDSVGAAVVYPKECFIEQSAMIPSMQGQIGCCVGCTFEEIVRQIVFLQTGKYLDLSWRFVYAMSKVLEGTPGYEMYARVAEGTYPTLAAKVIRKYGVPLAEFCPNDVSLSHEDFVFHRDIDEVPAVAIRDAVTRKSGADLSEPVSEEGIKKAITYAKANGGAVAILRRIGDSYWKDVNGVSTWDKDKILPIRIPSPVVSGHEEFLYGYDEDENGRVRIFWLNHWSNKWADNGRGWEYLDVWLPFINEIRVVVPVIPVVDNFRYTFTRNLSRGMKGPDVVALQHVLKLEGCFDYPTFTGTFGDVTFNGVVKLQEKYAAEILTPFGLQHGTGNVARVTLWWLNKHYGK